MNEAGARVRDTRRRLRADGPGWTRGPELDFEAVTLPEWDCDLLRDLLIAERVETVVEVGLAYGGSALAIGEALLAVGGTRPRHVVIDPYQSEGFHDTGWKLLVEAGLDRIAELIREPSSIALPRLLAGGTVADAAFVDGSHRFHEVFVDLYFLRRIVKPGGLIVLDDDWAPSVRTAVRYYERNLGWTVIPAAFARGTRIAEGVRTAERMRVSGGTGVTGEPRCRAVRLPTDLREPAFDDFHPFGEDA
ncbi:class I SAM-dependent methyltransferase [Actinoplanes hulinensis]|uniref:Class I SAM-dependent methyltransferase n=1 Tax=Actinoplanes hulinensis TaxID=1144547 RepID=A0ABS7BBY5_9ACTN|nr:class I SAM-dependent methyltransferase [Actinoplanes hulinensis]MBW6438538.1 class I SAM-dependent methyltransferase [Actinoplanes hulinensis]